MKKKTQRKKKFNIFVYNSFAEVPKQTLNRRNELNLCKCMNKWKMKLTSINFSYSSSKVLPLKYFCDKFVSGK